MNPTFTDSFIGHYATYNGATRRHIFGSRKHKIVSQSEDGKRMQLESPEGFKGYNFWVHINALTIEPLEADTVFADAAGGPLEVAKAEIKRLEQRLAELKDAVALIEGVA